MRYSLFSRFRGTLIGAVVGEASVCAEQSRQLNSWGKVAILVSAESLIKMGRFDSKCWSDLQDEPLEAANSVLAKAVFPTLPVMLFYHEDEIKLKQNLLLLTSLWQDDLGLRDGALAIGYAIAQSLTEKLHPTTLISQIIAFLGETPTRLAHQLAQVQKLLEQGAGLERAINQLSRDVPSTPIAMAFYCFLSTIEDPRLSILRAARTESQPQITTAITGALSGAYNSLAGIPPDLRLESFGITSKPPEVWGVATEAEMLDLSDSLLAVWSGIYDWTTDSVGTPVQAIAAPYVIRLR